MHFYKNTGCKLFMVGQLRAISKEENPYMLLERKRITTTEIYKIYIDEVDYARLCTFGYDGMLLSISGDLLGSAERTEIIATKIGFISMSRPGKWQETPCFQEIDTFDASNIEKLKNATSYQSSLYRQAMENVH